MIFHTRMTALRKGEENGRDIYGNPTYGPDVEIAFKGELLARTSTEPNEPNRDLVVTDHTLLIPPSVTLTAHDRVMVLGEPYELIGHPIPLLVGGRLKHYEAHVRRTEG